MEDYLLTCSTYLLCLLLKQSDWFNHNSCGGTSQRIQRNGTSMCTLPSISDVSSWLAEVQKSQGFAKTHWPGPDDSHMGSKYCVPPLTSAAAASAAATVLAFCSSAS